MKNTPNFFIVGGPKCGTTAMVEYLRTHPDVFLSEPKEPNFLADDMPKMKYVNKLNDYLNLFRKVNKERIIGDASIFYMYSKIAIKNIFDLNPEAKLLVMLRNPAEMAHSFHKQILFTLDEHEPSFEAALALEENRKNGTDISKNCRASKLLFYSEIAKYGEQLENIYKYFPKEQVKVILFDDFKENNRGAYQEVLAFLELEDDGRTNFPKVNEAKKAKSAFINKIVNRPPQAAVKVARIVRKVLNRPRLGILSSLDHINREKLPKVPLQDETRAILVENYKKDIEKAEKILDRDLSMWLS